jgi:uncharacterized protein (TIGR00730 family)
VRSPGQVIRGAVGWPDSPRGDILAATPTEKERISMPDNDAQMRAASYRLPARDVEFLMRDSMRGVRFLLEYAKAEEHLRDWGVRSTVVVFGSARVEPAPEGTGGIEGKPHPAPRSAVWYEEARRFGGIVSERGGALTPVDGKRDNVIATGGGPGIMEAANRGAYEAGAPSIGFNIRLPSEEEPNPYTTPELTFQFHYFAMRKMHLAMRANALVVFPGGFGTFDELFEILTLRQTDKAPRIPIVLFDESYWRSVINFDVLVRHGMIRAEDIDLFRFAEDAEGVWSALMAGGLKPHQSIE